MKLVKTQMCPEIRDYLSKRPYINLNILGKLDNNKDLPIFVDTPSNPSGVLVKSGYMHFLYTESEAFIDAVLESHMQEGFYGFAGVDRRIAEKIQKRTLVHWENPCSVYVYREDTVPQKACSFEVRPLREADAETVNAFYEYKNDHSLEDILRDIRQRPSSAVYDKGEPVCWVLVHEDDSMGIMYTKEAYRRHGLAEVVTRDLTQRIIEVGKTPYLQIVDGNEKSHGLARKSGFEKVGDCVWFGIIAGQPSEIKEMLVKHHQNWLENLGEISVEKEGRYESLYFIMRWLEGQSAPHLSAEKAESDQDVQVWKTLAGEGYDKCLNQGNYTCWLIRKDDRAIAAALFESIDEEDCMLHLLKADKAYKEGDILPVLMQAISQTGHCFAGALVEKSKVGPYKNAGFKSCGEISL